MSPRADPSSLQAPVRGGQSQKARLARGVRPHGLRGSCMRALAHRRAGSAGARGGEHGRARHGELLVWPPGEPLERKSTPIPCGSPPQVRGRLRGWSVSAFSRVVSEKRPILSVFIALRAATDSRWRSRSALSRSSPSSARRRGRLAAPRLFASRPRLGSLARLSVRSTSARARPSRMTPRSTPTGCARGLDASCLWKGGGRDACFSRDSSGSWRQAVRS